MVYDEFKRENIQLLNDQEVCSDKEDSVDVAENHLIASTSPEEESLQWAKEAYARLKQQQIKQQQDISSDLESDSQIISDSFEKASIKSELDFEKKSCEITDKALPKIELKSNSGEVEKTKLGEFDNAFTWSSEVLAAQGRKAKDISLEEIDWLGRLRKGLEKSRQSFVTGLLEKLGDDPLTPEVVDDLETLLLRADAGVAATEQILEALRRRLNEEVVDANEGLRFLKEKLRDVLDSPIKLSGSDLLVPERGCLNIWLLVGVNGVGKTTTLGKLANLAVRSSYSALIAAADTFRAAAVEQVRIWGERSGIQVIANSTANADPAAVVFDAIGAAKSKGVDLLLVDTAGRLQTKHNLMEELQKVRRIIDRLAPEARVESLLFWTRVKDRMDFVKQWHLRSLQV